MKLVQRFAKTRVLLFFRTRFKLNPVLKRTSERLARTATTLPLLLAQLHLTGGASCCCTDPHPLNAAFEDDNFLAAELLLLLKAGAVTTEPTLAIAKLQTAIFSNRKLPERTLQLLLRQLTVCRKWKKLSSQLNRKAESRRFLVVETNFYCRFCSLLEIWNRCGCN